MGLQRGKGELSELGEGAWQGGTNTHTHYTYVSWHGGTYSPGARQIGNKAGAVPRIAHR